MPKTAVSVVPHPFMSTKPTTFPYRYVGNSSLRARQQPHVRTKARQIVSALVFGVRLTIKLTIGKDYNVTVNGKEYKDLIWWYKTPTLESAPVVGHLCFYNEKCDIYIDGVQEEK